MPNYNESSVQVLDGLTAIRLRPGMYVGGTDKTALHHLIWEVVANSLDEHLEGFGDRIDVILHKDGSLSVEDFGRGIPLGIHQTTGKTTLETVLTIPHAGGKFNHDSYKTSGGLHGVGLTCVNALSTTLIAVVRRDGIEMTQVYKRGVLQSEKERPYKGKSGTKITFFPDDEIFDTIEFNPETIRTRVRQFAFLNPTMTLRFVDETADSETDFFYPNGLEDYINHLHKGKDTLNDPWVISGERDGIIADVLLQYTNSYSTQVLSFANLIPTKEGGTHETGVKTALTRSLNDFAKERGWIKENLAGEEWLEGLSCIISIKIPDPQFEGQTKNKLSNAEARAGLNAIVTDALPIFLQKDPSAVKKIAEKAVLARRAKDAAKKARELTRGGGKKKDYSHLVSGKYAPASGKKPEKNELYLVEGDSAGGSAKQGRDRTFQSILSLRGKPLNVEKARIDKALSNEEIRTIISAIGAGIGDDFDIKKAKYQKVVIMTDADVDGSHIRILLMTLFFRYMRPLIEAGYLYVAQPPLYKISSGKNVQYAYSDKEKDAMLKKMKNASIQRYKGLGEMNPTQLWETTMDPENRTLIRVTIEDAISCDSWFSVLMGDDVTERKEFLSINL